MLIDWYSMSCKLLGGDRRDGLQLLYLSLVVSRGDEGEEEVRECARCARSSITILEKKKEKRQETLCPACSVPGNYINAVEPAYWDPSTI